MGEQAEIVGGQAAAVERTTLTVTVADWSGPAAVSYGAHASGISGDLHAAAHACHRAATACRRFSRELHDAQHRARAARHDAEQAAERERAASRRHADAEGRASSAA